MEQLRVIQTNVQSKQSHLDYARNRRAAGVATELEVLRAEVDLENQRAEALRAENEVSAARATLNTVMVRPTTTPIRADAIRWRSCPSTRSSKTAVTGSADARVPSCSCCACREQVQDRLVDVAAADAKPRVDFNGSYGFAVRRPKNLFQPGLSRAGRPRSTWRCRCSTDGARPASVAQARAERNTVTQQIAALENQVRLDMQSTLRCAGAGEPHDPGGRAQRHAGAPRGRDDRGELPPGRGDASSTWSTRSRRCGRRRTSAIRRCIRTRTRAPSLRYRDGQRSARVRRPREQRAKSG